jgi:hypothetical protein
MNIGQIGFIVGFAAGLVVGGLVLLWLAYRESQEERRREQEVEFRESRRRLQLQGGRPTPRASRPGPPARQKQLRIRTQFRPPQN